MGKDLERSRKDLVIDSILEGGYTESELQEIIDVCEEEIEYLKIEEE